MRKIAVAILTIAVAATACAQSQQGASHVGAGATSIGGMTDLPIEQIGKDDLLGITVYDSPELTRAVRVDSAGEIRLPMLKNRIAAAGLLPADLETAIRDELIKEKVLVDPIVTVSVMEYRSRPVHVFGAVRSPMTIQAAGSFTLLDAISQAGGLTDNAGPEILVSRQVVSADGKTTAVVERISVQDLLGGTDPTLNVALHGGEEIRVPEAGKVYVVGNVKRPCVYPITDGSESSILKAMALSEGLDHYWSHTAYIYRKQPGATAKTEIPVDLQKIMKRKAPDVPLLAGDILYVPEATGRKAALITLDRASMASIAIATELLFIYH